MFKTIKKSSSRARVGRLKTNHGIIKTPTYIPVATKAKIKALETEDLAETKTQLVIANAFHLWLELGEEKLKKYPGLHKKMSWPNPIMTDSGGFQVFSLGSGREFKESKLGGKNFQNEDKDSLVEVTDKGVSFYYQKEKYFLSPEKSIRIQKQLKADIIYAFDEPSAPSHSKKYTRKAMKRTHRWAERSLKAKKSGQQLFGIVQGGAYPDLREKSAKTIGKLRFDGFGIGGSFGSSYGSDKETTFEELASVVPHLPDNKVRHLMGIGQVDDIFKAVKAGIDLFDCVVPTREARHGRLWGKYGFINITNAKHKDSNQPIDKECSCPVCCKISRGKLRRLFKDKDKEAGRLATIHNLYFFNHLMAEIRKAIKKDRLDKLEKEYLGE